MPRLQFSVATLLAIVTACACGARGCAALRTACDAAERRVATAERELASVWRSDTIQDGTDNKAVYNASVKLLRAQQAMPFAFSSSFECLDHANRMEKLRAMWIKRQCYPEAEKVHEFVEEALRWHAEAPR